jgi:hypothetical protein
MRRLPLPFGFAMALALFVPLSVHATSMVPQSLDELSTKSDAVVRVTTLDTRTEWRNRVIVTIARMRVTNAILGSLVVGQEIEVATLGGTRDGVELRVAGAPHFATGEDDVLFLGTGTFADWQVTDLAQGKFEVAHDASGREFLTRRDLEGVELSLAAAPPSRLTLGNLTQRVRSSLRIER